ncbi:MAG: DUF1272 domain-containing protein [Pseudomonadales bacterium]
MLELRSRCEHCAINLPPSSKDAFICSFECTFCRDCVTLLEEVCPNCGGAFQLRPVRPEQNFKNGNYLANYPAQQDSIHRPVAMALHRALVASVKGASL